MAKEGFNQGNENRKFRIVKDTDSVSSQKPAEMHISPQETKQEQGLLSEDTYNGIVWQAHLQSRKGNEIPALLSFEHLDIHPEKVVGKSVKFIEETDLTRNSVYVSTHTIQPKVNETEKRVADVHFVFTEATDTPHLDKAEARFGANIIDNGTVSYKINSIRRGPRDDVNQEIEKKWQSGVLKQRY